MQNRYVADVGDFGKFALLNALIGTDLRLGVMWYLNSVEEFNADGLKTDYRNLKLCDATLYDNLSDILQSSTRKLSEIETRKILPFGTLFYGEPLPFPQRPCFTAVTRKNQQELRAEWFKKGFQQLQTANLLFLDPDNGLAGKRVRKYSVRSVKYVFLDEVTRWLQRQQSVIVYQHQRRMPLETQISQQLLEFEAHGAPGWSLSFHRQSVRIYFVLPATDTHRTLLRKRTDSFCDSRWGVDGHFRFHVGN